MADELLGVLRDTLGPDIAYVEPPIRLGGGSSPRVAAFRLTGTPPPWEPPLVVRLFPTSSPPDLAHREAAVQTVLTDQGYPAARVLLFEDEARLLGRRFFVMERLSGRPMVGGIRIRELGGAGWRLFTRLPDVSAKMQAAVA